MVPGSTLMYGSNFCSRTVSPRRSSSMPMEAAVRPLPNELTTPPVTKMCLAMIHPEEGENLVRAKKWTRSQQWLLESQNQGVSADAPASQRDYTAGFAGESNRAGRRERLRAGETTEDEEQAHHIRHSEH